MYLKSLQAKVNLGVLFGLALVVLTGTSYLSYFSYSKTLRNYNMVNHSQEVLRLISDGESQMYEAESGVRVYVILQQSRYKPNVVQAAADIDTLLDVLRVKTSDNAKQQQHLIELTPLIHKRFGIWKSLVNDLYTLDLYTQDSLLLEGVKTSRAVTKLWNTMQTEEYDLLVARQEKRQSDVYSSPLFLLGASLASVLIVAALFYFLRESLRDAEKLQADLLVKNKELSRSNQDLEQFAYVASHDLQEPLRKLRAFGERLKLREKDNLSNEGKEIVDKLDGFAGKMQRLIDDLLQFSRIINTKVEGAKVDLNLVLQEAKNSVAGSVEKKHATINSGWLPTIKGYESQMQQLFQNLLSNSIKYSREGVPPVINIQASVVAGEDIVNARPEDQHKKFHKLEFIDNGIGFNSAYAEKIFVVFQRLHGKSEYEGTGIGLAITKSVVLNHNGYISAQGWEGKGAIFTVYLPADN